MEDLDQLKQSFNVLGLSDRELRLYVALLHYGRRSISFIAQKTGINRGTAYMGLHSLHHAGLITKSAKNKVQYFSVLPPERLADLLNERGNEFFALGKNIHAVLPQLKALANPLTSRPRVEYYEGHEGARIALDKTLSSTERTLRSFMSIVDISELVGSEYFARYTQRRIKLGYKLQVIRTLERDKLAFAKDKEFRRCVTSKKECREVRYVKEELAFPMTTYIFGQNLLFITSGEEAFTLSVQSKEMADMHLKLFKVIWQNARRC